MEGDIQSWDKNRERFMAAFNLGWERSGVPNLIQNDERGVTRLNKGNG